MDEKTKELLAKAMQLKKQITDHLYHYKEFPHG